MLADFRANVLTPLLRGERPAKDTPLALFAAEINHPLDYLFESNRWDEVLGASKRLNHAGEKLRAVLTADGYTAHDLLHHDSSSILALVHDQAVAARWAEAIERAVAIETDIVTVSTLVHPVTVKQLTGGLYGSPRTVIGVPGFNDYQERINRYYGLASPSTVPKEDAVVQRRHFGEVVSLVQGLLIRARESRQLVPFYESLAFAERCASCGSRPAEQFAGEPICGICWRKRNAAGAVSYSPEPSVLIWLEAVALDRLLAQQRSPLAYRRLYTEISETLNLAVPGRLNTTILASSGGWILLGGPASTALEAAAAALETIVSHYGVRAPTGFIAAVVVDAAPGQFRALYALLRQTLSLLRQTSTGGDSAAGGSSAAVDMRVLRPDRPFDRSRRPYTLAEARRLIAGTVILREAALPHNVFPQLAEQAARGSAGLYYVFERSKLAPKAQETFSRLEQAWDTGPTPGPRFYTMLADALALAQRSD